MRPDRQLSSNWYALMSLCAKEQEYREARKHPKLLRFVSDQIDVLARDLGFTVRQIRTREFRAEKRGAHIVRILPD